MNQTSRLLVCLAAALLTGLTARAEDKGKITIPDTVPAIWAEIGKQQGELATVIQDKKLADVHHLAYNIRDLVAALPAKAPADKKARVEGAAKNMAALADKLDAAGDNNKQADAEAGLKQLDALLKQLKSQFPDA